MKALRTLSLACVAVLASAAGASAQTGDPAVPPGYESQPQSEVPPPPQGDPYAPAQPSAYPPAQPSAYPPAAGSPQSAYPRPVYPDAPPPRRRELRSVSLTISPVHLFLPVVELMGDFRLIDKLSLAAILGFGTVPLNADGDRGTVLEVGTQLKFYAVGDFDHALQIGLEALFIHLTANVESRGVTGTGSGLAVGPFIGYKFVASFGFTLDVQAGFQYAGILATATDGTTTEEETDTEFIPLFNLNLGWSF